MSCAAPGEGSNNYANNRQYRFAFDLGRARGISRQTDQERAVRSLLRDVAVQVDVDTRVASVYSSRSQGGAG
eukprot:9878864-Lingulodinium_polyedra.AAC.1